MRVSKNNWSFSMGIPWNTRGVPGVPQFWEMPMIFRFQLRGGGFPGFDNHHIVRCVNACPISGHLWNSNLTIENYVEWVCLTNNSSINIYILHTFYIHFTHTRSCAITMFNSGRVSPFQLGEVSAVAISPVDPKNVGGVMMFRYKTWYDELSWNTSKIISHHIFDTLICQLLILIYEHIDVLAYVHCNISIWFFQDGNTMISVISTSNINSQQMFLHWQQKCYYVC